MLFYLNKTKCIILNLVMSYFYLKMYVIIYKTCNVRTKTNYESL